MFASPGLYGLCVAFCEAQDCIPDDSLDDPLENCKPSSSKILEIYDKKKRSGDPEMPCVTPPPNCPCWTLEELDNLRHQSASDGNVRCKLDWQSSSGAIWTNWSIKGYEGDDLYWDNIYAMDWPPKGRSTCYFYNYFEGVPEDKILRLMDVTPDEYQICRAQVISSGAERGFDCLTE